MKEIEERDYTLYEVAAHFGVSRRTVQRWLTTGILRGVRMGRGKGFWIVPYRAIQAFQPPRVGNPHFRNPAMQKSYAGRGERRGPKVKR